VIDRINLRDFRALSGMGALTILVDNDQSGGAKTLPTRAHPPRAG
jgi:hypothetical protein